MKKNYVCSKCKVEILALDNMKIKCPVCKEGELKIKGGKKNASTNNQDR